jgi:hypothetical protein
MNGLPFCVSFVEHSSVCIETDSFELRLNVPAEPDVEEM